MHSPNPILSVCLPLRLGLYIRNETKLISNIQLLQPHIQNGENGGKLT